MDPIEAYDAVHQLIDSTRKPLDNSKFELDYDSELAVSVREALQKAARPYAVGGSVVRNNELFDKKSIDEWMEFLGKTMDEAERAELQQMLSTGQVPVDALMKIATPAPFGKGPETVFDDTIRKAFEIPATALPNNLFPHNHIQEYAIKKEIECAMKPDHAEWCYKLYKMHMYGPGGMFQAHVDTLHESNHIATLVIGLPVDHNGGSLVVKHLDKTTTCNLANTDPNVAKYCAFFTDCKHEVEEVVSGWRVVIQYDIYERRKYYENEQSLNTILDHWNSPSELPVPRSLSVVESLFPQAEAAVDAYLAAKDDGGRVAILFNHRYALSSLQGATPALKGADSIIYDAFSSDKWNRKLQGLILTTSELDLMEWREVRFVPVSMDDFDPNITSTAATQHDGTTHVLLSCERSPGLQLESAITGNETTPDVNLSYFACCLVLEKTVNASMT